MFICTTHPNQDNSHPCFNRITTISQILHISVSITLSHIFINNSSNVHFMLFYHLNSITKELTQQVYFKYAIHNQLILLPHARFQQFKHNYTQTSIPITPQHNQENSHAYTKRLIKFRKPLASLRTTSRSNECLTLPSTLQFTKIYSYIESHNQYESNNTKINEFGEKG